MTILRPPRREPRALALAPHPRGIAFAVCDSWELRSCGIERCRASARALAVRRIVRREKPTVLWTRGPSMSRSVRTLARRLRLAILDHDLPLPPLDCARDLLPGMAYQAPTAALQDVVRQSLAAVLYAEETHRHYARRNRTTLRPRR